ncbi:MAG TPA: hypothetical protein VGJ07_09495 [Rugosimonospora sp.]
MRDNIREAAGCLGMILLWTVGGSLLLGVFAVPGIASWYLADRWWNQGDLGALAPYVVAWLIYVPLLGRTDRQQATAVVHLDGTQHPKLHGRPHPARHIVPESHPLGPRR